MKKIILMTVVVTMTFCSYGQKNEQNSAYNAYRNGYLDRAKTAIDKAAANEYTQKDARTWMYMGNIYVRLADANINEESNDKEFKGLCSARCAEIAYDAFAKAIELDKEAAVDMAFRTPVDGMRFCAHYMYVDAFNLYQEKKYEDAFNLIEKAYRADNTRDYIAIFNGRVAEQLGKIDVAKTRYNTLVRKKSKEIAPYVYLLDIYKAEKDTANVLKTAEAGVPVFFGADSINVNYAITYSVALSWTGQSEKAAEIMDKALKQEPNNYILLINYGSAMSNAEDYEKAEIYFKRAVELQPEELITVYNLGSCYYNRYVQRMKEIEDIVDNDEYKTEQDKAKNLLEQAQPYLEKAYQLDPNDRNTLLMLRAVYANLNLEDKLKEINEKL
jgi:tetratricopeptide (TPR) repeat protein